MATLNWIGKEKVINHHLDVPFRTLKHKYTYKDGKKITDGTTSDNKIIHGDNLEALKSLLPEYEGKIRCIYIDPPYNTGNEDWAYNDNVNHPKIKKWLGEVVGKEGEDLSRHDKWLCMMYPRIKLLHKLLSDDGVIFISIDENEIHRLRMLLDEVFGISNFIEELVWNKRVPKNDKGIGNIHEYILLYSKSNKYRHVFTQLKKGIEEVNNLIAQLKSEQVPLEKAEQKLKDFYKENKYDRGITLYNQLDNDYKAWGKINLSWPNSKTSGPRYDVLHPKTKKPCKVPDRGWRWTEDTFLEKLDYQDCYERYDGSFVCGEIWFAQDENTQPSSIKYLKDVNRFLLRSIISLKSSGGIEVSNIIGAGKFDYPKPLDLLKLLLNSVDDQSGIFLDSFAGSGTTAHAVIDLNRQDDGNRKYILVELEDYAENVTTQRVSNIIDEEENNESFEFLELGDPLFNKDEYINENQPLEDIRKYVYYTETRTNTGYSENPRNEYYLGKRSNTAYYFYYKKNAITTLDLEFASQVTIKADQYIIYADKCTLSEEYMKKHNIIFKKIPRDITRI